MTRKSRIFLNINRLSIDSIMLAIVLKRMVSESKIRMVRHLPKNYNVNRNDFITGDILAKDGKTLTVKCNDDTTKEPLEEKTAAEFYWAKFATNMYSEEVVKRVNNNFIHGIKGEYNPNYLNDIKTENVNSTEHLFSTLLNPMQPIDIEKRRTIGRSIIIVLSNALTNSIEEAIRYLRVKEDTEIYNNRLLGGKLLLIDKKYNNYRIDKNRLRAEGVRLVVHTCDNYYLIGGISNNKVYGTFDLPDGSKELSGIVYKESCELSYREVTVYNIVDVVKMSEIIIKHNNY